MGTHMRPAQPGSAARISEQEPVAVLGGTPTAEQLTREETQTLVPRMYSAKGSGEAGAADIALFRESWVHPSGIDIIVWPGLVPELAGRVPTVDEVGDLALKGSYREGGVPRSDS